MNGKRVLRGTAAGFLVAGPAGAAVGALMGSREKKVLTPAKKKSDDRIMAITAVAMCVGGIAWAVWYGMNLPQVDTLAVLQARGW